MNTQAPMGPVDVNLSAIHPTRSKSIVTRMVVLSCAGIGALVAWAATASLEEKAVTTGSIIPAGEVRSVQHLEGGIVSEILVREGATVEAGDVLIRLKRASVTAEHSRLTTRRSALLTKSARLRGELSSSAPDFSAIENVNTSVMDNERAILDARQTSLSSEIKVNKTRIEASRRRIKALKTERDGYSRKAKLLGEEVHMRQRLSKSGTGSRLDLIQARSAVESVVTEQARLNGDIAQAEESISETKTRIAELHSRYRERATQELGEATTQLAELTEITTGAKDRVVRLDVKAPIRGIVQSLSVASTGDVIAPGADVAHLVPIDEELVADIEISPADIGFVHSGDTVTVKVNAFDFARFGAISGNLESVSASTFTREDGSSYYRGRVHLDATHIGDVSDGRQLVPGMTLQADIRTGSKTLFEYMLKPIYTSLNGSFSER